MIAVFAVPLIVLFVCDGLIKAYIWRQSKFRYEGNWQFSFWLYLVSQVVTVWIYLQMLAWLSVLVGLKIRKPIAATVTSLAMIMAWAIVPLFLTVILVEVSGARPRDGAAMFLLTSPFPYLLLNQVGELREIAASPPVLFVLNTLIYGGAMLGLRALCFRNVGKLLEREDSSHAA